MQSKCIFRNIWHSLQVSFVDGFYMFLYIISHDIYPHIRSARLQDAGAIGAASSAHPFASASAAGGQIYGFLRWSKLSVPTWVKLCYWMLLVFHWKRKPTKVMTGSSSTSSPLSQFGNMAVKPATSRSAQDLSSHRGWQRRRCTGPASRKRSLLFLPKRSSMNLGVFFSQAQMTTGVLLDFNSERKNFKSPLFGEVRLPDIMKVDKQNPPSIYQALCYSVLGYCIGSLKKNCRRMSKVAPWSSWAEFHGVYLQLTSSSAAERTRGVRRVETWPFGLSVAWGWTHEKIALIWDVEIWWDLLFRPFLVGKCGPFATQAHPMSIASCSGYHRQLYWDHAERCVSQSRDRRTAQR